MIALSLVVQVATLSVAQDAMHDVTFELPLSGTATASLDRAEAIVRAHDPLEHARSETPPCLQAIFQATSLDLVIVLICEDLPSEEHILLGCTSLTQSAADGICQAIRTSYLLDM